MYRFPSWSFESLKLPMHLHVRHLSSHQPSMLQIWGAFSEILLKKKVSTSAHAGNCITWVLTDKQLQNRDHSKRLMTCHTVSPSQNSYTCHIVITLGWVCPFSPYLNLESIMVDAFQSQLWDSSSTEETDHLERPEAGLWHTWWAVLPKWTFPCASLLFFLNPSLVLATFCTCLFLHSGPRRWTKPILPRPDLNYFPKSFWSPHPHNNVLFHSQFPTLVHRQLTATTSIVRAPAS